MLKLIESYANKIKEVCEVYNVDNFNQYDAKGQLVRGDNAYKLLAIQLLKEKFSYKEITKQVELRIMQQYKRA